MGMKSAWSHVQADYVLFIPCDVTYIPTQVIAKLHSALRKNKQAQAAYVSINGDALYPFCLLKRESLLTITAQIDKQRLSLKECFKLLHAQVAVFQKQNLFFIALTLWMSFNNINKSMLLKRYLPRVRHWILSIYKLK